MPSKPASDREAERAAHAAAYDWPLPAEPYLPGITPRPPEDDDVHRLAATAPEVTDPERWRENAAYLAGFRLYNAGFGWEAHELWEPVWMHARAHSAEQYLVQGLIQLANGRMKLTMGREKAARRLRAIARDCLRDAAYASSGPVMGLEPDSLAGQLSDEGAATPYAFPRIQPDVQYSAEKWRTPR